MKYCMTNTLIKDFNRLPVIAMREISEWLPELKIVEVDSEVMRSHLWDLNPGPTLYESVALPLS